MPTLRVIQLNDEGDARGLSFGVSGAPLDFLGSIVDMHVMTLAPGRIRGNHYHVARNEVILVVHTDTWSVLWDEGADTQVKQLTFQGNGAVVIEADPYASHAVRNEGERDLHIVAMTNGAFDVESPDSYPRIVASELTK